MLALIDADILAWKDAYGYLRHGKDKLVHRTIVEYALGRPLKSSEIVHHVDCNPLNNKNDNLVVCPNQTYHLLLHARQRVADLGGHPDKHSYCSYHKCLHEKSAFSFRQDTWNGLHNMCRAATNEYRNHKGLNRYTFGWRARLNQQYRRVKSENISWLSPKGGSL